MFERTKVMDTIYMKHGVKLHELMAAMVEYDLENDEDFKAVKNSHLAERQQIMEQKKEEMKLPAEDLVFVKEVCDEIGTVDSSPDITGSMAYDEYVKIFTAVIKVQVCMI